ncbi:MAG: HNH endonuclease [Xanthomonadales bacterium]|nr:HNH endonuclease [Xanthomonadales bacterium]
MNEGTAWEITNTGELVDRLYSLRVDVSGGYEKPYKPALMLTILDLLGSGHIKQNRIKLTDVLVERFRAYIGLVGRKSDQPNVALPYWYLCGDGIWMVYGHQDEPLYARGHATLANPSTSHLRRISAYAAFASEVFNILDRRKSRELVRNALIARFFPELRQNLLLMAQDWSGRPEEAADKADLDLDPGRSSAFSNLVRSAYEYRCAACEVQVSIENVHVVEGCHLVPFKESYNDHPTNGISLCRNHHWALDRYLIAPTWERGQLIWVVSPHVTEKLDDRALLRSLRSKPVLLPSEENYFPSEHAIQWRTERLLR